jgi:hypothetical protein
MSRFATVPDGRVDVARIGSYNSDGLYFSLIQAQANASSSPSVYLSHGGHRITAFPGIA